MPSSHSLAIVMRTLDKCHQLFRLWNLSTLHHGSRMFIGGVCSFILYIMTNFMLSVARFQFALKFNRFHRKKKESTTKKDILQFIIL